MKKQILVIADYDRNQTKALEKAADIAKRVDADVEVVAFVDDSVAESVIPEQLQHLKQQVTKHFCNDRQVHTQVLKTIDLVEWTRQHCLVNDIDLVVKTGNPDRTLFHTPTDWQLIRQLKCPLLLASNQKWRNKATVLAAVDSGNSQQNQRHIDGKVLSAADEWRVINGHQLHAVYTVPTPTAALDLDLIELEEFKRTKAPESKQSLGELVSNSGINDVVEHIEFGAPEKRIPSKANNVKADLVVMGSVGRSGLQGLLVGNTAEKVLNNLRTDILVIKPD